jgi:LAS superfamily LD-carboxypeptidase LdcB
LLLVRLDGQVISKKGQDALIPPQYVTQGVYDAYTRMSQDMQKELGTSFRIESGYRSPAYQFYLFIARLPHYRFHVAKTARHIALPGQSEHGSLVNPAIDFINVAGINGEYHPKHFIMLAEYRWLSRYAHRYGLALSFPESTRQNAFEPWHWRYRCSLN